MQIAELIKESNVTESGKQTKAGRDAGRKGARVYRAAQGLFRKNPDWVTFFREILGHDGIVRQNYRNPESLFAFEQTKTYAEIQQMLAKLREQGVDPEVAPQEPVKVITVRIPVSLHKFLSDEADALRTSVNKLCISKLLQVIDKELVPEEATIRANLAKARRERLAAEAQYEALRESEEADAIPEENRVGEDL